MTNKEIDATEKNHYDILGVSEDASTEKIQSLTRGVTGTHHPDNTNITNKEFQRIKNAKNTLTNQTRRQEYDSQPRQLQIEANKQQISLTDKVSISVTETNTDTTTQYTITTPNCTTQTDGNGNVRLSFSEAGEKEIIANKQDEDTTKYLPDRTTVTVNKNRVRLSLSLTTKNGNRVKNTVTVGDTIHVTVRRRDTYESVENAYIKVKGHGIISSTGRGTFTVQNTNQIHVKCNKRSDETNFQEDCRYLSPTTQKELTAKINNDVLYEGDTLKIDVFADGKPEPDVTVKIEMNGATQQYKTTNNGSFTRKMNTPGVAYITLTKENNKGKTYTSYTENITVYQTESKTPKEYRETTDTATQTVHTNNRIKNQTKSENTVAETVSTLISGISHSIRTTLQPSSLRTQSADTSIIFLTVDLLTDLRLLTTIGKTVFILLLLLLVTGSILLLLI